nr:hypothetical protein [Tanacetum cinerariifolium]
MLCKKNPLLIHQIFKLSLNVRKNALKTVSLKKENEYAKLWNDWYKKCDECKYEKISYGKAYKDMQQKIERLQAQLGDLKGKSTDTSCVSDTRNPLSRKLENENVELEFQVLNYARENAHLKDTYKNLFDSISVSRTQTKTIIASLQNELQNTIYKNAKLRTHLFKKVSDQKEKTRDTSANTKFVKQSIMENLLKVGVDNTKTRRPQPRSNTKNDRVPSTSKSGRSKNKGVEKHKENVSIKEKQKKHQPEVKKTKKVGFIERLATPKPRKPRFLLRWSPTGRLFDQKGKIVDSCESESQYDCSKGDNACTSNPVEPTIKRFPNATFSLVGNLNLFMVRRLGLFQAHDRKSKASHQFRLEVYGNCPLWK